jgi:hypothetical protein
VKPIERSILLYILPAQSGAKHEPQSCHRDAVRTTDTIFWIYDWTVGISPRETWSSSPKDNNYRKREKYPPEGNLISGAMPTSGKGSPMALPSVPSLQSDLPCIAAGPEVQRKYRAWQHRRRFLDPLGGAVGLRGHPKVAMFLARTICSLPVGVRSRWGTLSKSASSGETDSVRLRFRFTGTARSASFTPVDQPASPPAS